MTLGARIKQLRMERGMTLEQVGDRVGVGKSTVRKWECGQIANMRQDKITLLAKALNVSPGYLMGWSDASSDAASPGERIANIMTTRGIDPEDIMALLECDYEHLNEITDDAVDPTDEEWELLSERLGVSVCELKTGKKDELNEAERELVTIHRDLNDNGQTILMGTARGLAANPDMKVKTNT